MILNFNVNQQTVVLMKTSSVPRIGSKEYLALQFSFSSDWENLDKLVYLQSGDVSQPISIVDNLVEVPEWFTEQDSFNVTLFGTDGTTEVPTNVVPVQLEKSNELWQKDAPEPQPSWLVVALESVEKAKASEDAAKISETNAANSASSAQKSAESASTSAFNVSASATAAAESANVAQTAQSGAESAKSAAAQSAQDAADVAATLGALPEDVAKLKQDVTAITPDDTAVNGKPWTSKKIVDTLCQSIEESGNPVQCYPVEHYPLGVKVQIEPTQAGSGDPSQDNVRQITGLDKIRVVRCGKNLFDIGSQYEDQWYSNHSSVVNNASIDGDSFNFKCANNGVSWAIRLNAIKVTQQMRYKFNYTVDNATGQIIARIIIRCFDSAGQIIRDSSALSGSEYNTYYNANIIRNNQASLAFRSDVESAYFGFTVFSDSGDDFGKFVSVNNILLEYGSTETAYEPYYGDTYDIALPETVYGGELDVETGVLTVTHGQIASYAGESLPGRWMSDRDVYTDGAIPTVGAQVVYELAEPYTIQLTPQQVTVLSGVNTIYTDANVAIVTGAEDPKHTITELKNAIISLGGNI